MVGQDDPLLALENELEQKEERKKYIERMMETLNDQKKLLDAKKVSARNILVQLALYMYEIERNLLSYQISDTSKEVFIDAIIQGFKQYFILEDKIDKQHFNDFVEIKVFHNKLKFEDIHRNIDLLLIKAKETIPEFKFRPSTAIPKPRTEPVVNQPSNEPQTNNYSWGTSIYSLFAQCFGGGNSSNHGYVAPIELDNHPRQQAGNR